MANSQFLTRDEARALAERVLAFSTADEARVNISSGQEGNTRFAVNQISTAGDVSNATVTVTSAFAAPSSSSGGATRWT